MDELLTINDRIERFGKLKSFLGGLLSQANSTPSDFVDISARTDGNMDCCTVTICLRWDAVGKLSIRSQKALANLRSLTERGLDPIGAVEGQGEQVQTGQVEQVQTGQGQGQGDTNQAKAADAYRHVFRDYNNGVRLVEKTFDGRVKVLQGKGDTRG